MLCYAYTMGEEVHGRHYLPHFVMGSVGNRYCWQLRQSKQQQHGWLVSAVRLVPAHQNMSCTCGHRCQGQLVSHTDRAPVDSQSAFDTQAIRQPRGTVTHAPSHLGDPVTVNLY